MFPKADSNILVPFGAPITALASGTVSGVNTPEGSVPGWGQAITVKLDNPLNDIATHMAYIHLGKLNGLQNGQHVNRGDILGYAGNSVSGAATGFALTPSDFYGRGWQWNAYTNTANHKPDERLDPVPFLNSMAYNTNNSGIAGYDTARQQLNNNLSTGSTTTGGSTTGGVNPLGNFFGLDLTRLADATLLFIVGLVLIIVGTLFLMNKMNINPAKGVAKAAEVGVGV